LLLNACEHASVQLARVRIHTEDHTLHIDIADDGVGFDPDMALRRESSGSGLWKARERLRSIDGMLNVDAAPGEGTRCTIEVPVEALHPDGSDTNVAS